MSEAFSGAETGNTYCGRPPDHGRPAASEDFWELPVFPCPRESDLRFNWIHVNLGAIDDEEMRDLVESAWSSCVPQYVAREYAEAQGYL